VTICARSGTRREDGRREDEDMDEEEDEERAKEEQADVDDLQRIVLTRSRLSHGAAPAQPSLATVPVTRFTYIPPVTVLLPVLRTGTEASQSCGEEALTSPLLCSVVICFQVHGAVF